MNITTTPPTTHDAPLIGRVVIVTGAARGIGAGLANTFTKAGAQVVLIDRSPAVSDTAAALGGIAVQLDLADPVATRNTLRAVLDHTGGVWCLVNNAGIFGKKSLLDIDIDEWDATMAINARAMLVTMQSVVPAMIAAGGGRVINLASMAAKIGTPGEGAYSASKAAVVAMSRIAALEFGPHGITVNAICPGYVLTDMGVETRDAAQVAAWSAKSPLGRLATVEDVAAAALHLASDGASYITGQAINVTGGMCTW